jgi:hypothetical protein
VKTGDIEMITDRMNVNTIRIHKVSLIKMNWLAQQVIGRGIQTSWRTWRDEEYSSQICRMKLNGSILKIIWGRAEMWCGQTFSKTNAGGLAEWGTLLRIFKLELKLLVERLNF